MHEAAPAAREMGYQMGRSCRMLGHLLCPRELGKARWRGWGKDGAQPERHPENPAELGECCCEGAPAVALL